MRRSGKSFLLFQLFKNHLLSHGYDEKHIIETSFDDFGKKKLRNADVFYNYVVDQIKSEEKYVLLLDEVQMLNDFVDVLNGFLHKGNLDIFVTGSNARFLSHDVVTEFRGRGFQIHIQPFSFSEFQSFFEGSEDVALEQYMRYGGLPPVALAKDDLTRENLLQNLLDETYISDIINRNTIKNDAELSDLLLILASNIGSLTNPKKISDTFRSELGIAISPATLKKYIEYFEDSFLISKANRFDVKGRHYIDTPLKYYFSDLGIRNCLLRYRQNEKPHLMENLIYNELCRRGYSVDVGVVILNGKKETGVSTRKSLEIDFVCNRGSEKLYIQSAFSLADIKKMKQETRSLEQLKDGFRRIVIVGDHTKPYMNDGGIQFVNVYDFLQKKE
mgnify:FL=1